MVTLPTLTSERPRLGASVSTRGERLASLGVSPERVADAPVPMFSRVAEEHSLGPATLDALIAQLPVGVLVMGRDGGVSYANDAARRLQADRLEPLRRAVSRALLTEEVVCEDVELRVGRGTRRWLGIRVTPVRAAGARAHAAVVSVEDITARRQAAAWEPLIESLVNL